MHRFIFLPPASLCSLPFEARCMSSDHRRFRRNRSRYRVGTRCNMFHCRTSGTPSCRARRRGCVHQNRIPKCRGQNCCPSCRYCDAPRNRRGI
ncbi:hypothetical protein K449DRAFT_131043 [Hypoxylon sp. EC38]|nr:hypothetical protein K449DRAFT_131043 [Hypoxylon sp. EC38]